jgi:hypothetical protein
MRADHSVNNCWRPAEWEAGKIHGDQIGRIFAYWVYDYFGQLFVQTLKVAPTFGLLFHGKSYVSTLTDDGLGYILADFFTDSSGRPGWTANNKHHKILMRRLNLSLVLSSFLSFLSLCLSF